MKKYSHAWLAFKAVERLKNAKSTMSKTDKPFAESLIKWFMDHRDGVLQGAWYPDEVIKDMANSHVLKFTPKTGNSQKFKNLPTGNSMYKKGKVSPLYNKPFEIEEDDNLPDRCESIAHSVIDNLKMQEKEDKGSPIAPTDNHVATLLFMLSHYVADAHVPMHCDSRKFSNRANIHGAVEKEWDDEIKKYYPVDYDNKRFQYDKDGFPKFVDDGTYASSFLKTIEDTLKKRKFSTSWGTGNNNVWDYMSAVCEYSYLISYEFIPKNYDEKNVTKKNWQNLPGQKFTFNDMSDYVFTDAIDSIAKVWFRVWRKYMKWEKKQRAKKSK